MKMSRRKEQLGFLDIDLRDKYHNTFYKVKGKPLQKAISDFEDFLEQKFGIRGFSAREKRKR